MKILSFFIAMAWFITGCSEIFEKDISQKEVELIAPADSIITTYTDLTFAWKELEGATAYRLVIVSPSFEKAQLYLLDTLVEVLWYNQTLVPGGYEWRVRPENSAYEGLFHKRQLTVMAKPEIDGEDNENL